MNRLIAAVDWKLGMAKHGVMPWNIPEDEHFFTEQTKTFGGNVLSGGVTFRDPYRFKSRPLVDRQNFILTRDPTPITGAQVVNDLEKFLKEFTGNDLWIAGGANVFKQVMELGYADELYLTHIEADFDCDKFFTPYEDNFELIKKSEPNSQNGFTFMYATYKKKS